MFERERSRGINVLASMLVATALLASACGGLAGGGSVDGAGEGQVGSEIVADETPAPADAEPDGDPDGADAAAGGETKIGGLEPLPADGYGEALQALVIDVHGPTDDVSAELNRLIHFPALPTPIGAHIIDLRADARPSPVEPDTAALIVDTRFVADGSVDELVTFYEARLTADGWSLKETENDEDFEGNPFTKLSFELPDDEFRRIENLSIEVTADPEFPKPVIEASYNHGYRPDPDGELAGRFDGWFDTVPLPAGGRHDSGRVQTTFGPGRTDLRVVSTVDYEGSGLADTSEEGLRKEVTAAFEAAGTDFGEDVVGGLEVDDDSFDEMVVRTFITETIEVSGRSKFGTVPFGGVAAPVVDQGTEPLPPFASREEIEAVINEIHGPTDDITTQMRRLGRFPDVPTPIGAEVIELTAILDEVVVIGGTEDKMAAIGVVEMWVDGDIDDVVAFYETTFAGMGWTPTGDNASTEDDGQTKVRKIDFDIPGIDAGSGNAFELTVTDDIDEARTRVKLDYTEFIAIDDADIDRWLGWQGDVPLPPGAEIESIGVSTNGFFGQAIFYLIDYDYPGRSEAELVDEIGRLMATSDYRFDPDDDSEIRLEMTHAFFERASFSFLDLSDRAQVGFQAVRPLAGS